MGWDLAGQCLLEGYKLVQRRLIELLAELHARHDARRLAQLGRVRGLRRFVETGCVGCHNGPLLGGRMLQRFVAVSVVAGLGSRGGHR
jgi:hypothetical protein